MSDIAVSMRRPRARALPPFQVLVDSHAAEVFGFLARRLGPVAAEDCFQETFLAALRAYPDLGDASNLRGWLLTIARRKLIDSVRAERRRPVAMEDTEVARRADVATGEPALADDGLWASVRALPAKQRRAVALRFVEDRSYDDIAQTMATSPEAARRNVHEGVKRLRREHG